MRVARLAKKKRKKKARRSGGAFIEQRARVYSISRTDDGRGHHRRRPQHISNFVLTTLSLRVSRRVPCVSGPTEAKHHHHHHHQQQQHRGRRGRVTTNHHGWRRRAREAHEGKTRPTFFRPKADRSAFPLFSPAEEKPNFFHYCEEDFPR